MILWDIGSALWDETFMKAGYPSLLLLLLLPTPFSWQHAISTEMITSYMAKGFQSIVGN